MTLVSSRWSSGPRAHGAAVNPAGHPGLVDEAVAPALTALPIDRILAQSGAAQPCHARQTPFLVLMLLS
jgi:hypothetical protein